MAGPPTGTGISALRDMAESEDEVLMYDIQMLFEDKIGERKRKPAGSEKKASFLCVCFGTVKKTPVSDGRASKCLCGPPHFVPYHLDPRTP